MWITGASAGIGAALAIEAARHGAKVAISARTYEKLEETKKRCLGRDPIFSRKQLFEVVLFAQRPDTAKESRPRTS